MRGVMLHALVLGASALGVEFQTSNEAPIFLLEGAQPASMLEGFAIPMPDMGDLVSMVNKMNQELPHMTPRRPTNPCDEDIMVTGCRDASCLKSHIEVLSPACAMFLLKSQVAMPSPSPQPVMAKGNTGSSYFSVSYMGEDGKMHTESGTMGSPKGQHIGHEMSSMLDMMMPGLASIFEEPRPRMPEPRQAAPPTPAGGHTCNDEVIACAEELHGNTEREAIQQCLISHYAQLSAECKCMLHQLMGDDERLPVAKSAAPPSVRTVMTTMRGVPDGVATPPRGHRFTCVIFMWMLFVSIVIVVRRLLMCCCAPKPIHVAFVPPETAGTTVSVEPLVITKEIK